MASDIGLGLRRRKAVDGETEKETSDARQAIASLDVFPKVPSDFKKRTNCGALLTISCSAVIIFLVVGEFLHYRLPDFEYMYSVDKDYSSKLPLSIDLTVAMPCEAIGADIVDLVNENVDIDGGLNEEATYFELSTKEESLWQQRRMINQYLSEEYHALHKLLWIQGYKSAWSLPKSRRLVLNPKKRPDACRFFGLVYVNKMAGNFHILTGKALHGGDLHAHISLFTTEAETNFSHRIERFAFGAHDVAVVNPLDGEEKIADKHSVSYQYNLKVVPTEVNTRSGQAMTYQYGVQSMERVLNHSSGSHGIPGIFIKYDIYPLKISVWETPIPIVHFLVRICGIVGGIFATTGIISSLMQLLLGRIFRNSNRSKIPLYKQDSTEPDLPSSPVNNKPSQSQIPNNALFAHFSDRPAVKTL